MSLYSKYPVPVPLTTSFSNESYCQNLALSPITSPRRTVLESFVCILVIAAYVPQYRRILHHNNPIPSRFVLNHALFSSATLGLRITHFADYVSLNCVLYGSLRGWKAYSALLGYIQAATQWVGAMILVGMVVACRHRTGPTASTPTPGRDGSSLADGEGNEPDEETPLIPSTSTSTPAQPSTVTPSTETETGTGGDTDTPRHLLLRITIFTLVALALSFFTAWFFIRPGNPGTTSSISTPTLMTTTPNMTESLRIAGPVLTPWDIFFILAAMFLSFCATAGLALADCIFFTLQLLWLRRHLASFPERRSDGDSGVGAEAVRVGCEWAVMGLSFAVLGVAQFWRPVVRDGREVTIWLGSFTSETAYLVCGAGFLVLGGVCAWRGYRQREQRGRLLQED